jgi:hypothetical protein
VAEWTTLKALAGESSLGITCDGEIPIKQVESASLNSVLRSVEDKMRNSVLDQTLPDKILKELEDGGMKLSVLPGRVKDVEVA